MLHFKKQPKKIIIAIIGLLFIVGAILLWWQGQQPEQPPVQIPLLKQPSLARNLQIPQGPIFGINATIIAIENVANDKTLLSLRSDLGEIYSATANMDTPIFHFRRILTETKVQSTRKRATTNDLEVGMLIYLQSGNDLLKLFELSPKEIKSIDIYVD